MLLSFVIVLVILDMILLVVTNFLDVPQIIKKHTAFFVLFTALVGLLVILIEHITLK